MQAPRESLCFLLLGDSNYCNRGHLSRGCGAVKPKPLFSHPSFGQQEPAAAIGPMTAHSEGLLSWAGVMAAEGSGGLGRGDLLAGSAGAHRPRRGGGGGHSEGRAGVLWAAFGATGWDGAQPPPALGSTRPGGILGPTSCAAGSRPPKHQRLLQEVLTPSVAARAGI